MTTLRQAVQEYVRMRRDLGFKLHEADKGLLDFVMFMEHRMRTFQGTFHANPDYAVWYGWSELKRDLTEIKYMGEDMRRNHKTDRQSAGGK